MGRKSPIQFAGNADQLELGFVQSAREVERIFLDWQEPLLSRAADYLLAVGTLPASRKTTHEGPLDVRHVVVATPSARAGGRLLEALVTRAEGQGRALLPPRVISTGALLDLIVPPTLPAPHPTIRALLWGECLRAAPASAREAVVSNPPSSDDWLGWLRLGELFDGLDAELAAGLLTFDEVVERARDLDSFRGPERWRALGRVRERLAARLVELQLDDAHVRRRRAIDTKDVALPAPYRQVVLVGAVDLNALTKRMLDFVRGNVTALIHAPTSLAPRFDRFGCVLASEWATGPVTTVDTTVVDGPSEQAASVAESLDVLAPDFSLQDVVVGVPDADVVPFVQETLDQLGVPNRYAAGKPMRRTGPIQLLSAVADYLDSKTFASLAALSRHPDIGACVDVEDDPRDWSVLLDEYQSRHVAHGLGDRFVGPEADAQGLALRRASLDGLLRPLGGAARPLSKWAEPIAEMFVTIYGSRPLDPDDPGDRIVVEVGKAIRAVLRGLHDLPDEVVGFLSAADALRICLHASEQQAIPEPSDREAIELLGWLELPLDDTPALVLTGFNDGFVPTSLNADPFLPDTLRRHLDLVDNRQRFARDAFFLSAILSSRRFVRLIGGRRTQDSDPLNPSRLALCADAETVARRVLAFFRPSGDASVRVRGCIQAGRAEADFPVPMPQRMDRPLTSLAVTAFRDYLACPYRFYLKHVLRLRRVEDGAVELDALLFGSLAHEVLCSFAKSSAASSRDVNEIRAVLNEHLSARAESLFVEHSHPAVMVQVEQLRARLEAFARWQAGWAISGKRILHAELPFVDTQASLEVDGTPFYLRGRIDRIDQDENTGVLYVLDYKVPSRAKTPEQDHRIEGVWTNLQLPLYRHMVEAIVGGADVRLGYINMARDAIVTESLANWSDIELQAADEVAKQIVRNVRGQVFWPPSDEPPRYPDEFSAVCQDARTGGRLVERIGGERGGG